MRYLLIDTFLSIILFLLISFISILPNLHPFTKITEERIFEIGFPYFYYYERINETHFLVGWNQKNFFFDLIVIWGFTILLGFSYRFFFKKRYSV